MTINIININENGIDYKSTKTEASRIEWKDIAPKKGDLLALLSVGAYGSVLSSNYNSRPTISEVLVKDHQSELIRDKIEIDEIVKRDKIPDWL